MNCEQIFLIVSRELDGDLTADEAAELDRHLGVCPACREVRSELQALDQDLARRLAPPPVEPAVQRLLRELAPAATSSTAHRPPQRQTTWAVGISVCAVIMAMIACWMAVPSSVAVAEIALATGEVEVKPASMSEWVTAETRRPVALAAHTRIRTRSESLCEIRTRTAAVVRMNRETEVIVHPGERLELVTGELWCRASPTRSLEVCAPTQTSLPTFACPSSTETQWSARPNEELTCTSVSPTPVQLMVAQLQCTIQPGERVELGSPTVPPEPRPGPGNRLEVTQWQLPLLLLRDPQDPELQEHLRALLATIGASKAAHFSEAQIRNLGPLGAIPLLAFVRSDSSREQPSLRFNAMRLASEMAPGAARPELEALLSDDEPQIRAYARGALERLSLEGSPGKSGSTP